MAARAEKDWGRVDILVNNGRRLARQDLRQDGDGGFRICRARASDRLGQLRQGRLGGDAGAQLWPHRAYVFGVRDLRQFRPGELRRGEGGHDRPHERAASRGREDRHPRQRACADRSHRHDGGPAVARRRGAHDAGIGDAGRSVSRERDRAPRALSWARAPASSRSRISARRPESISTRTKRTPETIAARFAEISGGSAEPLKDAFSQTMKFVAAAAKAKGVKFE